MKHRGINYGDVMKVLRLRSGDRLLPLGRLRLRLGHPRAAGVVGRRRQRTRSHIQTTSPKSFLVFAGTHPCHTALGQPLPPSSLCRRHLRIAPKATPNSCGSAPRSSWLWSSPPSTPSITTLPSGSTTWVRKKERFCWH